MKEELLRNALLEIESIAKESLDEWVAVDPPFLPSNIVGLKEISRICNEVLQDEENNGIEDTIDFALRVWPMNAPELAKEIANRDDAIRQQCAERAIAFIKTLSSEIYNLWSDKEDKRLHHAIISREAWK